MKQIDKHKFLMVGTVPIAEASPCGENARYEPNFELLEAELAKQESLTSETVDWSKVVELSSSLLTSTSKDLLVASYLCYGLLITEGYIGLAVGFKILADMSESHWDCLFPPIKRLRARATAFTWLAEKVGLIVTEKPPQPDESEVIVSVAALLKNLDNILVDKMGDQAPMLADVSRPLKNYLQSAKAELAKSEKVEESAVPAVAEKELETQQPTSALIVNAPQIVTKSKQTTQAKALVTGPIESEADSKKVLRQLQTTARDIASFWSSQKLADPRLYRLSRVASFMVVENAPPANEGITQIMALPVERLKFFEKKMNAGDFLDLIPELEKTIARSPFWLDGHFLVVKALRASGAEFTKAAETVIRETANFLLRIPELINLQFADQTPFASDQTKMWLQAEVLTSTSVDQAGQENNNGVDSWVAALTEASQLAASGDSDAALELINKGIKQAGQQRDQMYWRCSLAELLLKVGHAASATSILEQMTQQIDQQQLSIWEPVLLSHIYNLLFQSYKKQQKKNKPDEALTLKAQQAYEQLCWFDPVTALSLKGG